MTVPISKSELLSAISVTFDRLKDDLARIPESRANESSMPGHSAGTQMSPACLVSYLLGWNRLVLKWLHQDDQGIPVDFLKPVLNGISSVYWPKNFILIMQI